MKTISQKEFEKTTLKMLKKREVERFKPCKAVKYIAIFDCPIPNCDWTMQYNLSGKGRPSKGEGRLGRRRGARSALEKLSPFQENGYGESPIDNIRFRFKSHLAVIHDTIVKEEDKPLVDYY